MSRPPGTDAGGRLGALLGRPFTAEQLAAATAPLAPQLIVAGAGTGKTAVMAARVVHAVRTLGVPADRVLGLTFTTKAAAELAERVDGALDRPSASPGIGPSGDGRPTVATYHAFAAGLLREHAGRLGREPPTAVLSEAARWQLALTVVRRASGPFPGLTWTPATVARHLLALEAELSEHLADPAGVARFGAELTDRLAATPGASARRVAAATAARSALVELLVAFRAAKCQAGRLDHGDQIRLAAELAAAEPEVGRQARHRYRLVLLDEYQDTGTAQCRLLAALFGAGHPVTAVGDPQQAIYGWRGASVGNLHRFPEQFGAPGEPAVGWRLSTSFRCAARIVTVADRLIGELAALGPAPPVGGERAALRPAADAPPGRVRAALLADAGSEARWVAHQLRAAVAAGTRPGEAAVLCRRRAQFPELMAALTSAGLPVEVVGLGGLLHTPEVADLLATLRVLADPGANAALLRVLAGPRWRIGPRDLAALGRRARWLAESDAAGPGAGSPAVTPPVTPPGSPAGDEPVVLLDAVVDPGPATQYSAAATSRLAALASELAELADVVRLPAPDAVAVVIATTGLDAEVAARPAAAAESGAANLAAFTEAAGSFVDPAGRADLRSFLAFCDAAEEAEDGLDAGTVSAADTVKLMTVHAAKGLEWPVVAVPGLTAGSFPGERGRPRWPTAAQALPWPLRGDAAELPALAGLQPAALAEFADDCRKQELAEELRLGYVAFTRARRLLLLSGSWWTPGNRRRAGPSRLLETARSLVAGGTVELAEWVTGAEAPAENPQPGRVADVAWPARDEPAAAASRAAAAAAVSAARAAGEVAAAGLTPAERAVVAGWHAEARLLLAEAAAAAAAAAVPPAPPRRLTATELVGVATDPVGAVRRLARPLPTPAGPGLRRGSRFHAWVAAQSGQPSLWDAEELPGAADDGEPDASLAQLQRAFLAGPYAGRTPVAAEAGFELALGDRLVRGRIDAVYPRPDGGFEVVDFKTGELPGDRRAAAVQLAVYRLAWAELAGVAPDRVDAAFYLVATGEVYRPPRLASAAELAALAAGGAVPGDASKVPPWMCAPT